MWLYSGVVVFVTKLPFLTVASSIKSLSLKSSIPLNARETDIFKRSAPGAAKLLNPLELSVRFASSSEFIVSSKIFNPILPVGVSLYWSKIIVSELTVTKLPLIK